MVTVLQIIEFHCQASNLLAEWVLRELFEHIHLWPRSLAKPACQQVTFVERYWDLSLLTGASKGLQAGALGEEVPVHKSLYRYFNSLPGQADQWTADLIDNYPRLRGVPHLWPSWKL